MRFKPIFAAFAVQATLAGCGNVMPPPPDLDKDAFDASLAYADIEALSGETMMGRIVGSRGNRAAAEFIERRLTELGFEVTRQPFMATVPEYSGVPAFEAKDAAGQVTRAFEFRAEFRDCPFSGKGGMIEGAFAVTTYAEAISGAAGPLVILPRSEYDAIVNDTKAMDIALAAGGVKALIFFAKPGSIVKRAVTTAFTDDSIPKDFGFFKIVVDDSLYPEVSAAAARGEAFSIDVPLSFRRAETWNVVGIMRAAQPGELPPVYVTAHYDSVGADPDGAYFPAALDNASGVAAMLEIARAVSERKAKLARDFAVIAFSGEEEGSRGAILYALSPLYPLRGAPLVNLDMVGTRAPVESIVMYLGAHVSVNEPLLRALRVRGAFADPVRGERSAHAHLYRAGASAVSLIEYSDAASRSPEDRIELTVDAKKLDRAGGAVTEVVLTLLLAAD
jgi:hypothetical protein